MNVRELLEKLAMAGKKVAVEKNGEIVPKGRHHERWYHLHGCGRWFNAIRDTVSDQIEASHKLGEER